MACPICGHATTEEYAPFCNARCQLIDLGHWIDGTYRLPSDEENPDGPVSHPLFLDKPLEEQPIDD